MPKRILVVSPTPTHPPVSGNRARIGTLLAHLARMGHAISFLHIERERGDRDQMRAAWGSAYHAVPYAARRKAPLRIRLARWLRGMLDDEARYRYGIDDWWDNDSRGAILDLHAKHGFDVVMVEYAFFSRALTFFGEETLKIIDTHDVFTDRHKLYLKNGQRPRWFSTSRAEEARALNRADLVLAIQDQERSFLQGLTATPVITVGHAVTLVPPERRDLSGEILYVGGPNPINASSCLRFIDEALERIQDAVPGARLLVAGQVCESLPDRDGVEKLGAVDDLGEIYRRSDVVVNPMLYGTGLKIKTVEALGYAKPVVTTEAGAVGLEHGTGTAFLVADDFRKFADHVISLMSDSTLNDQMSRAAFELAAELNATVLHPLERALNDMPKTGTVAARPLP